MKNTTKKSIIQKIIISVLTVLLLANFMIPTISRAEDGDLPDTALSIIQRAIIAIGDGVMWLANGLVSGWEDAMPVYVYVGTYGDWFEAMANKIGNHYVEYPVFQITPEKIFANKIKLLDVNIIDATEDDGTIVGKLKETISSWYQAFRNLAIVAMLSVLVYVAIRIILSSTGADKAKYKTMLKDWLIGFALIFFMHYIIAFSINAVEALTETINSAVTESDGYLFKASGGWTRKVIAENYTIQVEDGGSGKATSNIKTENNRNEGTVVFDDFMGYIRWNASAGDTAPRSWGERFAYSVLYFLFIFYTVSFLYKYLKRVVTTVFLVVISPFVAFSYTLDKAKDGSAQGFSTWLKEFIFNLLIQPMHLLLYYVLVTSAIDLAKEHLVYVAVVLGFLLPAEKILREMFGFNNAKGVSSAFGGAMAGAGVMGALGAVKNLTRSLPGGGNKPGGNNGNNGNKGENKEDEEENTQIRTANNGYDPTDAYDHDDGEEQEERQTNNNNEPDDSPLPDEDYQDYYNNPTADFAEQQSLDDQMREIEENDYNYASNPEWIRLNEQREREQAEAEARARAEAEHNAEAPAPENSASPENPPENPPRIPFSQSRQGRKIRGWARAIANNHKRYGGKALGKLGRGLAAGTRFALKATGAAAGLTMGVAAGLASDDYSNVLKYGAAGIAGGMAAGGAIGNAGIGLVTGGANLATGAVRGVGNAGRNIVKGSREFKEDIMRETLSEADFKDYKNAQLDKQWAKNKEVRKKYANAFIGEDYKSVMVDAQKYRDAGITDDDLIIKAMKLNSPAFTKGRADERKIASTYLSQFAKDERGVENIGKQLGKDNVKKKDIEDTQQFMRELNGITYRRPSGGSNRRSRRS